MCSCDPWAADLENGALLLKRPACSPCPYLLTMRWKEDIISSLSPPTPLPVLASYYKVCVRLFIQLSWKPESLQAVPLSFPCCLFHFSALQMLLCIFTIVFLSLAGDMLTAVTAAHVLCTEGSRTVNLNQLFMKETTYRLQPLFSTQPGHL